MKKYILLTILIMMGGCATAPPKNLPKFPEMAKSMEYQCPELTLAKDSELLSELVRSVTINYGEYHKCRAAVEAWHLWYQEQKKIYEGIKNE